MSTEAGPPGALRIGEVAARTELSFRTLHHWDEVGLLRPSGRTVGGFRLYTEADVEKLLLIRRMKPLGFTLEVMGEAVRRIELLREPDAEESDVAEARELLRGVLDDADVRRDALVRQLAMAEEFIEVLGRELDG